MIDTKSNYLCYLNGFKNFSLCAKIELLVLQNLELFNFGEINKSGVAERNLNFCLAWNLI